MKGSYDREIISFFPKKSNLCMRYRIDTLTHPWMPCTKKPDAISTIPEWISPNTTSKTRRKKPFSFLKEWEWIETSGQNKIIRSSIYSPSLPIEERQSNAISVIANMSNWQKERIGKLFIIISQIQKNAKNSQNPHILALHYRYRCSSLLVDQQLRKTLDAVTNV